MAKQPIFTFNILFNALRINHPITLAKIMPNFFFVCNKRDTLDKRPNLVIYGKLLQKPPTLQLQLEQPKLGTVKLFGSSVS